MLLVLHTLLFIETEINYDEFSRMFDYPLTLTNAEKLKSDLTAIKVDTDRVTLNIQEHDRVNLACVQLFISFYLHVSAQQKVCEIYVSKQVFSMLSAVGVDTYFQLKGDI
jgi:ABC-type transporter Mla MlaB component